ncbi:MAG: hypothetical protein IPJ65_15695 [Archangiaceae bacterium]|nr:hypothetical protein [Archangiaceae bacterium]
MHHPLVGTLVATASAHVATQSATVPAELVGIAEQGSVVYGLFDDFKVKPMGAFPALTAGASLVDVRAPTDRTGNEYAGFIASNGHALISGYTRFTAGYPGNVAVVQVDAGVQYVNAPGNFTAAGFSEGFVVNGTGLGTLSRTALFALNTTDGGISQLAEIDAGTKADGGAVGANSGFTAVTGSQVLLLGYFSGADFDNSVYAAPPLLYTPAVQSALPFALERAALVAKGDDIVGVSGFGNDALIVHGSYQTSGTYDAYTTKIERVPLTLGSLGVTVGAPVTLFTSADECTSVLFTTPSGSDVLVGIKDKNGRRVVRLTP